MAVIAAQYLQGYSFSGRLHADNMVRRVRKIVREIDSLEAFKLRNIHSHETSPFCNLNLGCVFLAQIQVITTFTSTLGVNTAFLMKRPPRVSVFIDVRSTGGKCAVACQQIACASENLF